MILHKAVVKSPVGRLILVAKDDAVVVLAFGEDDHNARRWLERRFGEFEMKAHRDPAGAASALRAYFKGDLAAIDRVKVDTGGTEFQQAVWAELRRIPAGSTLSYAGLAARVGRPSAVRAVGAANGGNPVAVIVPCHRVIAADGSLCGYGGGLDRKRWLLAHEKALPAPPAGSHGPRQSSLF